jgi:copper chaperone
MEKIILHVEGMSCGHCENAVREVILKLPGIQNAVASKSKKEAVVEFDPAVVSREQIAEAINETGYEVVE